MCIRDYVRLGLIVLCLSVFPPFAGYAQVPVMLDQWPARLQLYPRDQTNQCAVAISGRVLSNNRQTVSLVVFRDRQRFQYIRQRVDSLTGRFAFKPTIKAERSEYSFQLFAHRTNSSVDSILIAFRDSIVCGDAFLVTGQSNALGGAGTYRNEFCRSFGVNRGDVVYNPADTAWCLTNTTEGFNSLWGGELQQLIKDQYSIPTAIINGGAGGTRIENHADRDENQPTNLATLYGRLLYRAQKAGVASQVKALIWRQGEAEAAYKPEVYMQVYPRIYSYWKQDYPGLKKIYHGQLNLLIDNIAQAGALRDFQRRSKAIFGDNEPMATVGLAGYLGVHYSDVGLQQFGVELYRLVARDFYGSTDTSNIQSPNIQRLFYSSPQQDEITLEFEPGQLMRWPADTVIVNPVNNAHYTQRITSLMYLDNVEIGPVNAVKESNNRLILKLGKTSFAKTMTYMPASYTDAEIGYFAGPVIRNRRGMRALTFNQVPIAPPLPVANDLQAISVDTSVIELRWNTTSVTVNQWIIERADSTYQFRQIALIPGSANAYNDFRLVNRADSLQVGKVYYYRIRSLNEQAEATYSPIVTASLQRVLGIEYKHYLAVMIYPNPTRDQAWVRLPQSWTTGDVTLTVFNDAGAVMRRQTSRIGTGTTALPCPIVGLPAGTYVLTLQHPNGMARSRVSIDN